MSRGNRAVVVRLEPKLREWAEMELAKHNEHATATPMNISDLMRRALVDWLKHRRRSRSPRSTAE